MYEGIITKIVNIREHPNADRLNLGTAAGHQVVISKDIQEGTLGVFFPCDGRFTEGCLKENNLYRHKHLNKDPEAQAGFFDDNGRIRAQKFRKAISEGFWTGLNILAWTGVDLSTLKEGDSIHKVNGYVVCQKYYTPATLRAMKQGKASKKNEAKESFPDFKEHWSTGKLRMMINFIPDGAILYFSEKVHGTSGRTGYLPARKRLGWFRRFWNRTVGKSGLMFQDHMYKYVSGTRRVVLNTKHSTERGFYSGKTFRIDIHNKIKSLGLHEGETLYYEIVGFDDCGGTIMGTHGLKDEGLKKRYGDQMSYTYGCDQVDKLYKILVYRITYTTPNGSIVELPHHQFVSRCGQLGMDTVPSLEGPVIYNGDKDALMDKCEMLSRGDSTLDSSHIKEGVVIKVHAPDIDTAYKYKGWHFCSLEDIQKNTDDYIDLEDIS